MTATLDLDEMFHLAIMASQNGDHEKAILYLKEGAEKESSARFFYLLGAEYAELKMYQRAVENIEKALDIEPDIHEARFQLGLLWGVLNDMQKAEESWLPLNKLGKGHFLYMFKTAILTAAGSAFSDAISMAEAAIKLNTGNPALNNDMRQLIQVWSEQSEAPPVEGVDETDSAKEESSNYFLSAYQDKH